MSNAAASKGGMMKTYAVLYAPEFRLQATVRHAPHLDGQPIALLNFQGKKPLISELNAMARSARVEIGMTPTQALARCAELHLLSANSGHERSAQDTLLQTAETLSPFIEATAPGVVTVELPAERPYTEAELIQKCTSPLALFGLDVHMGVAGTPDLALLSARFGDPVRMVDSAATFLRPLPVDVLQPSAEILSVLHGWGIRTIGELVALPMGQVCERLGGPEAVELWERATGGRSRPLKLIKPQEFFAEQADLENAVEMLEPLLFLLRRFLEQIALRLANGYLVAGKPRLVLRFENGSPYQRIFTIPQPTRDVNLLFRMLHTHLENFTSESPIIGLELAAKPVRPNAEQFGLLEKGLRDPHQLAETLARLQGLLGSDRVGTPELEPSAHPDAFHLRPYDANATPFPPSDAPLIGVPWLRFHPPIPANIVLNDVQPAFLYSSRFTGPIKETCGPWLLEGNWWEKRRWSREEWDAATEDGVYRLVHVEDGWFLDGIYA
jgi:protein ImuB